MRRGRCPEHDGKAAYYAAHPRGSAAQQGYGAAWRRARAEFLATNPWCIEHAAAGQFVRATVVDHRTPHRGDAALFWDRSNWQPLCKPHHDAKTAREGRWGRGIESLGG